MVDKNSKKFNYLAQLGILLGLTCAGFIAVLILSALIWVMMQGLTFPAKNSDIFQLKYYNTLMVIQAVTTFFLFFLPVYVFAMICYKRPYKFLGFNLRFNFKQILLVLSILLLTFPLSAALGEWTKLLPIPESWAIKFKAMEVAREAQEATLIQINSFSKYIISLFIIGLLPGIFEETFFRAGMQNLFTRWFRGPWIAIILTSIIFSIIHASFYGFFVRFGLGVILGFIFYYSGSLWLSILLHFLFNGIQVTALYAMNMSGNIKQAKDLEKNLPMWAGLVSLALIFYLFILFKKVSEAKLAKYPEEEFPDNDFDNWTAIQPKL
ncbi:MAG: CPBP family intramembrane glutamic endopeptidase [Ginsengibacter sp.]